MTSMPGSPAGPDAGWSPDPAGQPGLRWWNGVRWGEETQPLPPPPAGPPAPYGPGPYGQAPYGQSPYGQAPYAQPPYSPAPPGPGSYGAAPYGPGMYEPAPYGQGAPGARVASRANSYSTTAIVFGIVAVLILPIIFGPAGLVLGAIARSKGEPRAGVALVVAGAGMIIGFLVGALFLSVFGGF